MQDYKTKDTTIEKKGAKYLKKTIIGSNKTQNNYNWWQPCQMLIRGLYMSWWFLSC